MAKRRNVADDGSVMIDGNTGLPMLDQLPPSGSEAPDTAATRKTDDMYWSLLGNDKEGTGYITVHYLANGKNGTETLVMKEDADVYPRHEIESIVQTKKAPMLHPGTTGTYRIRLYVHDGTGYRKRGEDVFNVMADAVSNSNLPVPQGTDPAMVSLIREMMAKADRDRADMIRLIEERTQQARGPDAKEMLAAAQPFLLPFVSALAARIVNPPKRDGLGELRDLLAITGTIKDMRAENTREPDDDVPWYAAPLAGLIQNLPGMMAAGAMRLPAPKSPAPPPVGPAGAPQAPEPVPMLEGNTAHPFYQQLAALVGVAAEADPEEVAQMLWGQVPEQFRPQALEFLTAPGYFRRLAEVHPGVMDHPGFFADLADCLIEIAANPVQTAETHVGTAVASDDGGQNHGN